MIAFDLRCGQGHTFEGWFDSANDFESQKATGMVLCPVCNDENVTRMLSPVTSVGTKNGTDGDSQSLMNLVKAVSGYVKDNFEDVGVNFSKEALKMHYGVTPARNIRGSSTEKEEETLREEGIDFIKMPIPKTMD